MPDQDYVTVEGGLKVPKKVMDEFNTSLDADIEHWSKALEQQMRNTTKKKGKGETK